MNDLLRPNLKGMIVNITHTPLQVFNLHKDIRNMSVFKIPNDEFLICMVTDKYDGIYENLVAQAALLQNEETEEECYGLILVALANEGLNEITNVEDDEIVFLSGEFMVEIFTDDIHYICCQNRSELVEFFKHLNIPENIIDTYDRKI